MSSARVTPETPDLFVNNVNNFDKSFDLWQIKWFHEMISHILKRLAKYVYGGANTK